jgi:hypothetical protein
MDVARVREDSGRRLAKIRRNTRTARLKIVTPAPVDKPADDPRDWWRTRFMNLEYVTSCND